MRCLVQKGYRCILVGDYNGHIGDDEEGIPGNKESINLNGSLLRTLVKSNHLELINVDEELTTGKFTRSAAGNSTILDLSMTTPGDKRLVEHILIDEDGTFLPDSNHAVLILDLNINKSVKVGDEQAINMILNIPRNSYFSKFQENLDGIMSEPPVDQEELCGWLQRSLIQAGTDTFELKDANLRVSKKPVIPKSIQKLRSERRILERKVKRGTIWKTKYSVAGRIWTDRQ